MSTTMATTDWEKIWKRGEIPVEVFMPIVDKFIAENELTYENVCQLAGLSNAYFTGSRRVRRGVQFAVADKILCALDMVWYWNSDELNEHYMNVRIIDHYARGYKKCSGCGKRMDVDHSSAYCGDKCREMRRQYRVNRSARIKQEGGNPRAA